MVCVSRETEIKQGTLRSGERDGGLADAYPGPFRGDLNENMTAGESRLDVMHDVWRIGGEGLGY